VYPLSELVLTTLGAPMDKTRKPSLVLLALLTALATLPFSEVKPNQRLKAQTSPEPIPTFTPPSSVAEGTEITIDGTPSMAIINRSLESGFEAAYPGTDVMISANGDETALQGLRAGEVDLAAIGRPLSEEELAQNLTEVPISREKIAIIVGRDNPFQGDLTFEDFARIFWGEITNWSQVGGPDLPLIFIDRPGDSDTRIALSDYDVFKTRSFETGDNAIQVQEDDTAAIVRELGNNGVSYAIAGEIIGQDAVRPVSMHNTMPNDPRYPYSQPRGYVYQGEASIPVEAFLGYATNPDGQQDVAEARETEKANVTAGAGQLPEGVAIAPDGQFMVRGTQDGELQWLDAQGNPTNTIVANAHKGMVTDVVISPDGQTVITSGADGVIRRWDRNGSPIGDPIQGTGGPILSLAFSPDGQTIVSGNANGTVERWSLADGASLGSPIAAHDGPVQTLSYPPGGQNFITGSSDDTVALWNADGSLATKVPNAHKGGITDITSSPDGQTLITAGGDGTIRQWDRATLQPRGEAIPAHNTAVSSVAVSPDGSTIATAGRDATLQYWDPTGTPQLPNAIQLDAPASSLGYTADGNLVAATTAGQVDLRDGNGNSLSDSGGNGSGLAELYPDLVRRIQNLPRETWWMLAVIPALLVLAGIIGALLGIKRDDKDTVDLEAEADDTPDLNINFSGIGESAVVNAQDGNGVVSSELPPEAGLVPIEGDPIGSTGSKLEQARNDLAEGKRLMREGRNDDALIYFNSAIEATEVERYKAQASGTPLGGVNAIAAQAQAQRGNALVLLGQPNEALDSYNTALKIDSSCIAAWIGKGRLLTSLGRFEEAIFCFDTALEMDESSGAAWAGKGQALMQLDRQAEAQECLAQARALGFGIEPNLPTHSGGDAAVPVPDYPPSYGGSISPTPGPVPVPAYPPDTALNYDPDIPLELQQAVAAIPSEDMILPEAPAGYYDVPPELLEAVANLPVTDVSRPQGGISPGPLPVYPPSSAPDPQPITPGPAVDSAEDLIDAVHLPSADNLDEMLSALEFPEDLDGPSSTPIPTTPTPSPTPVDSPAPVSPYVPEVPLEPGDFVPPPPESTGTAASNPWESLPPEVIAAMNSIPANSPDNFGPLPEPSQPATGSEFPSRPGPNITPGPISSSSSGSGSNVVPGPSPTPGFSVELSPPVVPLEPGDFVPPPPTPGATASGGTSYANLPPDVLAAMASIPADSPDSFGLGTSPAPTPAPGPNDFSAGASNSWIKLTLDQGNSRFYASWQVDGRDQTQITQQGGSTLSIRLHDVTGQTSTAPLGDAVNQLEYQDINVRDCYLPIPQINRIYLTELGFLGPDQRWYSIARSNAVPAIS
jgi:ABC-type phosphate transport system substrate-binding protein/tetratricopeptide (TPR) repeat protein